MRFKQKMSEMRRRPRAFLWQVLLLRQEQEEAVFVLVRSAVEPRCSSGFNKSAPMWRLNTLLFRSTWKTVINDDRTEKNHWTSHQEMQRDVTTYHTRSHFLSLQLLPISLLVPLLGLLDSRHFPSFTADGVIIPN